MPRVSVIVPVYNSEPYLHDCVGSIVAQTCRDLELILVDDGSRDRSGEILDGFAEADSRIRVVHKENGGQSSARNAGLDLASGQYIYLPDSDDVLHPKLLETVIPRLDEGFDMVAFRYETFPVPGRPDGMTRIAWDKETVVTLKTDEEKYAFLTGPFRRRAIRWEPWNRVFRRDLIEKWKIRFPADRGVYPEDMFFSWCYVAHSSAILLLPDVLYRYIRHEGSVSDRSRKDLMISTSHLLAGELFEHYAASADCRYLTERFPSIYYLLHKAAVRRLRRYQWRSGLSMEEAREIFREAVPDHEEFRRIMAGAYRDPAVTRSYRQDRGALLQLTDRLYMAELLEMPAHGAAGAARKAALEALRVLLRRGNI